MTFLKKLLTNFWNNPKKWRDSVSCFLIIGFLVFMGVNYTMLRKPNSENRLSLNFASQNLRAHTYDFQNLFSSHSRKDSQEEIQETFPFNNIKLEAKAAYVFDIPANKPIFEFNADVQVPLASLAKIMTAVVAIENLPPYLLVSIPPEAILTEGDSGFFADEKMLVANLGEAMLISSSNDAAVAFEMELKKDLDIDFISLMNKKAGDLGLGQTYFLNSTGLDFSKNTAGAQGSAKDIANLILYAVKNHPSLMEATRLTSINIESRKFQNTNLIINEIPGFIAGKTGYSDLAGGNLAIIADKGYGHPIIIVVLGSTFDGRFTDVKNLYNLIK